MAPPLLNLDAIKLTFGGDPLLDGAALSASAGDKIALVGRNGSGKSTLLKIAAGLVEPQDGEIFRQPSATIRYLPQAPDMEGFTTVRAYVEAGLGPADDPHRATYLMEHLGLSGEELPGDLSGGEARRAALARVMAPEPDILLLDEPTNHLDLQVIEWLEEELARTASALVLISHDRRFLERVSRATVWLDRGQTRRLDKGFAHFEAWRDQVLEEEEREQHKLGRQIVREEHWLRYGVTARRKRNMRRLGELQEMRQRHRSHRGAEGSATMVASDVAESGKLVIEAKAIGKRFGDLEVVKNFSTRIQRGDRVGLVGPNGAGKTTLLKMLTGELAPDTGSVRLGVNLEIATLDQKLLYARQVYQILSKHPETAHVFQIDAPGTSIAGMVFTPWDQRKRTTNQLQPIVQNQLNAVAGVRVAAFQLPPLPGSQGLPVQFVLKTTDPFDQLDQVSQNFLQAAVKSGMFIFLDSDLKIDSPQSVVQIDRNKTAQLGLKMSDVGAALGGMLGGAYVNYFSLDNRSYKVIPQVQQKSRLNVQQLMNYYVGSIGGVPIPLSSVATITSRAIPESINHFQQLNSATIQGVTAPGVAQADALTFLQDLAKRTLPQNYSVDYGGLSRQYIQESSGFIVTFGFALIIIYLALAALFESFRDPIIILVSVPMSIAGALIFISVGVGGASLNIYTEVGLVTLMGLISKHGILIVEFANALQQEGKSKREAIEQACGIRLRPILMTTAAMVLGVSPLILASGAGAVSRFNMGLVIASGLAIGTMFTLFVVPAVYMMIAQDHSRHVPAAQPAQGTA